MRISRYRYGRGLVGIHVQLAVVGQSRPRSHAVAQWLPHRRLLPVRNLQPRLQLGRWSGPGSLRTFPGQSWHLRRRRSLHAVKNLLLFRPGHVCYGRAK